MLLILFFYGLAFILMSVAILLMPKRNDFFGISDNLWLLGLFGLSHGINEWVDLLILRGGPIDVGILKMTGAAILPVSFLFLVAFGGSVISKRFRRLNYLKYAWIAAFAIWAVLSAASHSIQMSGIFARYLLCFPGTILSALGLSAAMNGCREKNIPKVACLFARFAIGALLLYGILSGLVTPKADLFLASFCNYSNFTMVTGIPVQFFRMLLAIILAISFFVVTGISRRTDTTILTTGGIKRKVGFAISITAAAALLINIFILYMIGSGIIKHTTGLWQSEITKTLALVAAENISDEVKNVETYASRRLWERACETANLKYAGMSAPQIEKMMLDTDKIWIAAREGDELIKSHTSGDIPDSMREIEKIRTSVSEIFITDEFGGLIKSSGRTSDFYQADESWWQKAFNSSKGAVYFSPIEYDASSKKWGSAIASPIKDPDNEIIGICKVFVQTDKLFNFLDQFKLGSTGHAMLVDDSGVILVHKWFSPLKINILNQADFSKLKKTKDGFMHAALSDSYKENLSLAIYQIDSETLKNNGINWYIITAQDSNETLGILNIFLLILLALCLILIPLTIPVGFILGGNISKPIDELSVIANLIAAGDLDHSITIRTGDEIEQLAETFRNMIFAIKASRSTILKAKENIDQLAQNQETTIQERTKELVRSQEATLNILEDLVEAKDKLQKYAKDLEEAIRVKTDFTATVSHELRTPLAAIKEGIAIVLDGTAGRVEIKQKEFLEIARRNVDRLTRLINDLLDFQKLEAGRMEFNIVPNDINKAVEEAARAISNVAEKKELLFKFDLEKGLPIIEFDYNRIEQVLTNLLSNAIRYTDKGSITLRTRKTDNFIMVSVEDTGIGIKKENIPRLFQRFVQLEPVSDRRVGGTGLGLSISKDIIDFHNGKMTAESEPGVGSTISFILPINP